MRARGAAALIAGVVLATGVAACGGDDEESDNASAPPQSTATAPAETGADTAADSGGSGELTPPGTKLSVGETATVGWNPPSLSSGGRPKSITLEVTVVSLEKKSTDDLEGVNLDDEQKSSTPYFLKVRMKNLGERGPEGDQPDLSFDAIDDRGQEQGSITFIGDFPPCEDKDPPKPFTRGKEYETCLTYLVPGGGSIEEVRWKDGPPDEHGLSKYYDKPIVWSGG